MYQHEIMDPEFCDMMSEPETEGTASFDYEIDIIDSAEMEITSAEVEQSPVRFLEAEDNREPESSQNKIEIFYFDCGKEPQACDEFECSLCFKIFSSEKSLATHGHRIHGTIKPFKCDLCPQRYRARRELTNHVAKNHRTIIKETESTKQSTIGENQVTQFSCKICGKFFTSKSDKLRHENHVHKRPPHCPTNVKDKARSKKQSENLHNESGHFTCQQCGELFQTKKKLLAHEVKEHATVDLCPCKFCGEQLEPGGIVEHYETRHPDEYDAEERNCHLCDALLKNRTEFHEHMQSHRNRQNRTCEYCGNTYSDQSTLKRHIVTQHQNSDEKKHPCTICDKECYSASRLREHLRFHTGDKPFECETCFKTFKSARSVKDHKRTHTGEKPYVCEYCDKAFTHREGWKYHMRSAHGIDPVKKRSNGTAGQRLVSVAVSDV